LSIFKMDGDLTVGAFRRLKAFHMNDNLIEYGPFISRCLIVDGAITSNEKL
jgi:hypothetical protein